MITLVILIAVYIVGAILTYASNGWLVWTDDEDTNTTYAVLWPILVWAVIAFCLRRALKRRRQKAME